MSSTSPLMAGPSGTASQHDVRSVRAALPYLSIIVLAQVTIALLLVLSAL